VVDDIGRALGVVYDDAEELKGSERRSSSAISTGGRWIRRRRRITRRENRSGLMANGLMANGLMDLDPLAISH